MKTRQGFVSNSSSSSFVIAYDNTLIGEKCPHCGHSEKNFLDRLRDTDDGETAIYAEGYDEVMVREFEEDISEIKAEHRPKVKAALEAELAEKTSEFDKYKTGDMQLARIAISYHNEDLNDEFHRLIDQQKIIIVKDEN